MVSKTPEEWDAMTAEQRKAHLIEEEKIVFGTDFKKVKGQPVEQGIGAPGHESHNHFASIRKREGEDAYREAYDDFAKRNPERFKKLNLPKPNKVG